MKVMNSRTGAKTLVKEQLGFENDQPTFYRAKNSLRFK